MPIDLHNELSVANAIQVLRSRTPANTNFNAVIHVSDNHEDDSLDLLSVQVSRWLSEPVFKTHIALRCAEQDDVMAQVTNVNEASAAYIVASSDAARESADGVVTIFASEH